MMRRPNRRPNYIETVPATADYIFSASNSNYTVTRGDNGRVFRKSIDSGTLLNAINDKVGTGGNAHIYFKNGWYKIGEPVVFDINLHLEGTKAGMEDMGGDRIAGACLYASDDALLDDFAIRINTVTDPDNALSIIENLGFSEKDMVAGTTVAEKSMLLIDDVGDSAVKNCIFAWIKHETGLWANNHGCWIFCCDFEDQTANSGSPANLVLKAPRNFVFNSYFARNFRGIYAISDHNHISDCVFDKQEINDIRIRASKYQFIHDCIFTSWNQGDANKYSIDFYDASAEDVYSVIHDCLFDGDESGANPSNYHAIGDSNFDQNYIDIHDCRAFDMDGVNGDLNDLTGNANGNVHDNIG